MTNCPHDVYAKELMPKGWGYPLWQPELAAKNGGVQIGDVGIIDEGGFEPFFNVHTQCYNPENNALPPNFKTLQKPSPRLTRTNESLLSQGLHSSESVKTLEIMGGGEVVGSGVEARVRVKCTSFYGACLYLKDCGSQEKILPSRDFKQYIKCHYRNWEKYLNDIGSESHWSNLVLVTGTIRTSAWVLASFMGDAEEYECSFNVPIANLGSIGVGAGLQMSTTSSPVVRAGSSNNQQPGSAGAVRDQTVFIHYLRAKPRPVFGFKIEAQGPGQKPVVRDHGDEDSGSGSSIVIENTPGDEKKYDPLDDVLDYILENSEADVAFADTLDIIELFEGKWPQDMRSYLKTHMPKIEVIGEETKYGSLFIDHIIVQRDDVVPHKDLPSPCVQDDVNAVQPASREMRYEMRRWYSRLALLIPKYFLKIKTGTKPVTKSRHSSSTTRCEEAESQYYKIDPEP
ncbi:hypothetical protein QCA50_003093 [Cerrena zonata]|uniref:Uncharacterized protein n=1 Tax=Cerrena zonata TaxID=2478898 RepID=A0AAW0GNU9_9APHY